MTARGVCPVCGALRALRRDGMIRGHLDSSRRCEGSGALPATKDQRAGIEERFADRPNPAA